MKCCLQEVGYDAVAPIGGRLYHIKPLVEEPKFVLGCLDHIGVSDLSCCAG